MFIRGRLIKLVLLSGLISIISEIGVAQEPTKEKIILEKISETTIEESIHETVDIIMPTDDEIEALKKEGKTIHPKVIMTKKYVKFFDKEGKLRNKILLNYGEPHPLGGGIINLPVFIPPDKILVINCLYDAYNLFLIDLQGNIIWHKGLFFGDVKYDCFTSRNGKYILIGKRDAGHDAGNDCILHDIDGKELWRESFDSYTTEWFAHLLRNGRVILGKAVIDVLLPPEERYRVGGRGEISLIDVTGRESWTHSLPRPDVADGKITLTDFEENNLIVLRRRVVIGDATQEEGPLLLRDNVYVFDEEEGLLWEEKMPYSVDNVGISPDSKYLILIASPQDNASIYFAIKLDSRTGRKIWQQRIPTWGVDISFSSDGKYIALASNPRCTLAPKILCLLDAGDGTIIGEIQYPEQPILGEFRGNRLLVRKGRKLLIYEILNREE